MSVCDPANINYNTIEFKLNYNYVRNIWILFFIPNAIASMSVTSNSKHSLIDLIIETQAQLESYQLNILLKDMYCSCLPLFFADIICQLVIVAETITTIGTDVSDIDCNTIDLSLNYIRTTHDTLANYNSNNRPHQAIQENTNTRQRHKLIMIKKQCAGCGGSFTKKCLCFYGTI